VLEESLERALDLSAAMESRGFGYHKKPTKYRPEGLSNLDLTTIAVALYLLIFTPTLITFLGSYPALLIFGVLAIAPLLISKPVKVVQ
jgi:energy-coupling factor transporter transmembrane protein EcfT